MAVGGPWLAEAHRVASLLALALSLAVAQKEGVVLELPLTQELALGEGEEELDGQGDLEEEGEMVPYKPTDAVNRALGLLDLLDVALTLRLREPLPLPQKDRAPEAL